MSSIPFCEKQGIEVNSLEADAKELGALIQRRASNMYMTGQLHCSEAVLMILNRGLKGGLSDEMAIRLASALPEGLGGSACLCGAVSGGALALGLFLGRSKPGAQDSNKVMAASKELHHRMHLRFGSSCCSSLKKGGKKQCSDVTATAARLAAELILQKRPELGLQADWEFLIKKDHRFLSILKRGADRIRFQIS